MYLFTKQRVTRAENKLMVNKGEKRWGGGWWPEWKMVGFLRLLEQLSRLGVQYLFSSPPFFSLCFLFKKIYVFLAMLGLRCCSGSL